MISQDQLRDVVLKELRDFNLSIGWINPDECYRYEEYETNYNLLYFEVTEYANIYLEATKDFEGSDKEIHIDLPVTLVVDEFTPYDNWQEYRHEFILPNLHCFNTKKSFTEAFKESVKESHRKLLVEDIKHRITNISYLSDDDLLNLVGSKSVVISFDMKRQGCEIISVNN